MPTEAELEQAKENLRNLFFGLAFDPDSRENADQADAALRELDRLLAMVPPAPVPSPVPSAVPEPAGAGQ